MLILAISGSLRELTETLSVMSGRIVPEASITVAVSGRLRDELEICAGPTVSTALRPALEALASVAVG